MSQRTKSMKRWGAANYNPESRLAQLEENRSAWDHVYRLNSRFGARTDLELIALRRALIERGTHPHFILGVDDFLRVKPPLPREGESGSDLDRWSFRLRFPPELYDYEGDWSPNFPGDYVAVRFQDEAYMRTRYELDVKYAQRYSKPMPALRQPRIYVEGMDDTNEELDVPNDAAGLAIIELLIAGQPLSRADFHGLGFRYT